MWHFVSLQNRLFCLVKTLFKWEIDTMLTVHDMFFLRNVILTFFCTLLFTVRNGGTSSRIN
jgi:hypothetical protein